MRSLRVLVAGVGCAFLVSCAAGTPDEAISDTPTGLAASPYNYLPGLVEVPGGFELFGELTAPAVSLPDTLIVQPAPEWLGPTHELNFNGSNLAYELTEDAPTDCLCPSLGSVGDHYDFITEVDEPLRSGWMALDMDIFWTIRAPTVLVEAFVMEAGGDRVVGSVTRHFEYPWRERVEFGMFADFAGVLPGQTVGVRFTMVDSEPGPPSFVFNAGPGDRLSTVALPVLN